MWSNSQNAPTCCTCTGGLRTEPQNLRRQRNQGRRKTTTSSHAGCGGLECDGGGLHVHVLSHSAVFHWLDPACLRRQRRSLGQNSQLRREYLLKRPANSLHVGRASYSWNTDGLLRVIPASRAMYVDLTSGTCFYAKTNTVYIAVHVHTCHS